VEVAAGFWIDDCWITIAGSRQRYATHPELDRIAAGQRQEARRAVAADAATAIATLMQGCPNTRCHQSLDVVI